MITKKPTGRGGRRPGAGRPRTSTTAGTTQVVLPADLLQALQARAEVDGVTQPEGRMRALSILGALLLLGCGVAPAETLLERCGMHPERPESPIYCVCIRACPGQHQCALHMGECDPFATDSCEQLTGYSESPENITSLAEVSACER